MSVHRLTASVLLMCAGTAAVLQGQQQAGAAKSTAEREVIAAERAIWEDIKNNQWASFDKTIAGMTYVEPGGIVVWKPGTSEQFNGIVTKSYSLDSVTTRVLAPDIVVLTYRASFEQTAQGKPQQSPVYMMSIWQRKGGKWTPVAHSETPSAAAQAR